MPGSVVPCHVTASLLYEKTLCHNTTIALPNRLRCARGQERSACRRRSRMRCRLRDITSMLHLQGTQGSLNRAWNIRRCARFIVVRANRGEA